MLNIILEAVAKGLGFLSSKIFQPLFKNGQLIGRFLAWVDEKWYRANIKRH